MNKTRDQLLEPNPYNNHGIHWKAVQSFINEYTEKYGGVYGPRRDSDGVLYVIRNIRYQAFEKGDKQLGWNDIGIYLGPADYLAYQVRRAEDPRFVEWIYQKKIALNAALKLPGKPTLSTAVSAAENAN